MKWKEKVYTTLTYIAELNGMLNMTMLELEKADAML